MIELKEGLGGNGLQPYDTTNGKWITVNLYVDDEPIADFDGFKNAFLGQNADYLTRYKAMSDNDPTKKQIDNYLFDQYKTALQTRIDELNEEQGDADDAPIQFFDTVEEMIGGIDRYLTQEMFDDMISNTKVQAYGKGLSATLPKWIMDFHKRRYGRVKFRSVHEKEFQYLANQSGAVKLYRGLGDLPSQAIKENIFNGFTRDGEGMSKSLLACGSGGRVIGSGIYMAERLGYSQNNYTAGSNMLIKVVYNINDCKVIEEDDIDSIRTQIRRSTDFRDIVARFVGPDNLEIALNKLIDDKGLVAMMMGYDRLKSDDDISVVLNPNKMYCSKEWRGN